MTRFEVIPGQIFFPAFSEVMSELFSLVVSGVLAENFFHSLWRVLIGFLGGSACGLLVGILMGW